MKVQLPVGKAAWWKDAAFFSGIFVVTLLVLRQSMPRYLESFDAVYFTLGLQKYSVLNLQPQWPGYPVYLWFGHLLLPLTQNVELALHLVSICATACSTVLVAALARLLHQQISPLEPGEHRTALLAALLFAGSPLNLTVGTEIYSDALALTLGLLALWLALRGYSTQRQSVWFWSGVSLGLMLGVRISYVPLLLAPLYVCRFAAKHLQTRRPWGSLGAGVLLTCSLWLGWQLAQDGSGYFKAAQRHLGGHYGAWGGSILTDSSGLSRGLHALETFVVYSWGGWWPGLSISRLVPTIIWGGLFLLGIKQIWRQPPALSRALVFLPLPYLLWLLISHDVNLDRYFLPLFAWTAVIASLGLPQGFRPRLLVVIAVSSVLVTLGVPVIKEHVTTPPAEVQTVRALALLSEGQRVAFVAPQVTPLIKYYAPAILALQAEADLTDEVGASYTDQGFTVYTTSFTPNLNLKSWQAVARYCRSREIRSREVNDLTLYRYSVRPFEGVGTVQPCTSSVH